MNISSKENGCSEVRVRAQVMMRDDSSGGWLPMGGGGLSNVSVRKRKIHHQDPDQTCRHEYLIHGRRISDNSVVLSCTIKKDFEYNKVMPTFHHWKTGNKKFGLTFQTAADARAFDKGVRIAIQDLLDGISETSPLHQYNLDVGDDDVFMQLDLPLEKRCDPLPLSPVGSSSGRSPSPSDDPNPSSPPPTNAKSISPPPPLPPPPSVTSLPLPKPPQNAPEYVCMVADPSLKQQIYPQRTRFILEQYNGNEKTHFLLPEKLDAIGVPHLDEDDDKEYPYVKFARREPPHEYSYPKLVDTYSTIDESKIVSTRSSFKKSNTSIKKSNSGSSEAGKIVVGSGSSGESYFDTSLSGSGDGKGRTLHDSSSNKLLLPSSIDKKSASPKPGASGSSVLLTCAHCRETFTQDNNKRGTCAYAPVDCVRKGIEVATCLQCAKCLLYHCMSDTEGDYVHPCDCSNSDGHWLRRWIGLSLLSILVPCLCCYLPFMACYKCGRACNVCGGRHAASS